MFDPATATIRTLIDQRASETPDSTYLIRPETGRRWSYAELRHEVSRIACGLHQRLGVRPGDRVGILMTTRPECVFTWLAVMTLGAIAVPINIALRQREIAFILGNCAASALVVEARLWPEASQALQDLPALRRVALLGERIPGDSSGSDSLRNSGKAAGEPQSPLPVGEGEGGGATDDSCGARHRPSALSPALSQREREIVPFADLPRSTAGGWPPANVSPASAALIVYTSGTTGNPKGAVLTHRNLLANARQIAAWHCFTPVDRTMLLLPLFHVNGLVLTLLTSAFVGASAVIPECFSASRFWKDVADYGVVWFSGAPTILSILLNAPAPGPDLDVSSLRYCLCGTAPLPVELFKQFEERFKVYVIEGYGMTETACRSTFNPHPRGSIVPGKLDRFRKIGSVGLPIGNEMQVVDDQERPVAAGIAGEIVLRGENVIERYWGIESAASEAFRNGWFHSGDLGYQDEDGYYFIVDRKKDIIIRGGENISPREVDEVLYQHPAVREAATVGLPDEKYGEEVAAFVALADGAPATADEIIAFCRERLAPYKCPKSIVIIPDLPKGPTGKLLRRELREWARR